MFHGFTVLSRYRYVCSSTQPISRLWCHGRAASVVGGGRERASVRLDPRHICRPAGVCEPFFHILRTSPLAHTFLPPQLKVVPIPHCRKAPPPSPHLSIHSTRIHSQLFDAFLMRTSPLPPSHPPTLPSSHPHTLPHSPTHPPTHTPTP